MAFSFRHFLYCSFSFIFQNYKRLYIIFLLKKRKKRYIIRGEKNIFHIWEGGEKKFVANGVTRTTRTWPISVPKFHSIPVKISSAPEYLPRFTLKTEFPAINYRKFRRKLVNKGIKWEWMTQPDRPAMFEIRDSDCERNDGGRNRFCTWSITTVVIARWYIRSCAFLPVNLWLGHKISLGRLPGT